MRMLSGLALAVALILYAALLASRNSEPIVMIDLIFRSFEAVPLWLGLLGAFALGAAFVGLGSLTTIFRLRLRLRRGKKQITRLEQEVHGLRTLPLEEDRDTSGKASSGRG